MADAVKALVGEKTVYEVRPEEHSGGSTDVGDVQHLLPVITFNTRSEEHTSELQSHA